MNSSMEQAPVIVEVPPPTAVAAFGVHSARHSVETLVVVLAVITIAAVFAGMFARMCGGRHGDHDIEGWVESKCRSCLDGGIPPLPQSKAGEPKK